MKKRLSAIQAFGGLGACSPAPFMKFYSILFFILLISLFSCGEKTYVSFSTGHFQLGLSSNGMVTSIEDLATGKNHLARREDSPFLSLFDTAIIHPVALEYDEPGKILILRYPTGSEARVQVGEKGDYLHFELLSVEPRGDITQVIWGPYVTSIIQTIGETICVVRDSHFAFGLQSLEPNTTEGPAPEGFLSGVIDPLPGQTLPDSLKDAVGTPNL
jgi:hypothetical protein